MKLNKELKNRIDRYFDEISADELYSILTEKYNFTDQDNETVIVNDGKYLCDNNRISEVINKVTSYANIDVKLEMEVVKMKFLEDTSDSQDDKTVYDQICSISFAA